VIEGLLKRVPAAKITAAVQTAKVAAFATRGVQVRTADYNEPEKQGGAFEGAARVLLIISSDDIRQMVKSGTLVGSAGQGRGGRCDPQRLAG
jgi:NAD(P)H dehydrogenase (quinone)